MIFIIGIGICFYFFFYDRYRLYLEFYDRRFFFLFLSRDFYFRERDLYVRLFLEYYGRRLLFFFLVRFRGE